MRLQNFAMDRLPGIYADGDAVDISTKAPCLIHKPNSPVFSKENRMKIFHPT
jgi:hypothetical protein